MRNLTTCLLLSGLVGCGGDSPEEKQAKELYARVKGIYRSWERPPAFPARTASDGPHGGEVEVFINDVLATASRSPTALSEWPHDSIVVKEGYTSGELRLIPMMEKQDSGWFYAELDAQGEVLAAGQPQVCTSCHRQGSDFLWTLVLP